MGKTALHICSAVKNPYHIVGVRIVYWSSNKTRLGLRLNLIIGQVMQEHELRCLVLAEIECCIVLCVVRPMHVQLHEGQHMCAVCNDVANGIHFGALTCEGCKVTVLYSGYLSV